jgi:glutaconate CoA-transferase subunit A
MYRKLAADDAGFQRYLDDWVWGPESHEEYLAKVGVNTLLEIKADPVLGYSPGLDRR